MQPPENLNEIIQQCKQGRPEGFEKVLDLYGPRLHGYFLRTTASTHDADDLVQELFVRLIEKIAGYHHDGRFEHWLFRIAANLARDRARRRRRRPEVTARLSAEPDAPDLAGLQADAEPRPDEMLAQAEQVDQLQNALRQLPEIDREIIILRHYGRLSFKDLAQHFGMPLGTALAKVHRGLKQLRRIMTPTDPES